MKTEFNAVMQANVCTYQGVLGQLSQSDFRTCLMIMIVGSADSLRPNKNKSVVCTQEHHVTNQSQSGVGTIYPE